MKQQYTTIFGLHEHIPTSQCRILHIDECDNTPFVHPAARIDSLLAQHPAAALKEFAGWKVVHGCPYVASVPQQLHHPCNIILQSPSKLQ